MADPDLVAVAEDLPRDALAVHAHAEAAEVEDRELLVFAKDPAVVRGDARFVELEDRGRVPAELVVKFRAATGN